MIRIRSVLALVVHIRIVQKLETSLRYVFFKQKTKNAYKRGK